MHTLRSFVRAAFVTGVVAGGMQSHAAAQPDDVAPMAVPAAKVQNALETRLVHVRNVRPGIIAWWLDPLHATEPVEFKYSRQALNGTAENEPKKLDAANGFKLPEGITAVLPVDSQNILVVLGTTEAIRQLEPTIELLDKPIRQVEVSVQVVQVSPEDAKSLNIEFPAPSDNAVVDAAKAPLFAIGHVPADLQDRLDELVKQNKARIINSPRLTTMNNLNASLGSAMMVPATIGIKDEAGQFKSIYSPIENDPAPQLLLSNRVAFGVTPSVNNDDTITLTLRPSKTLEVTLNREKDVETRMFNFQSFLLKTLDSGTAVINVKDKETIALTGSLANVFIPEYSLEEDKNKNPLPNVIVFVTAKIHRRTEDLVAIRPKDLQ